MKHTIISRISVSDIVAEKSGTFVNVPAFTDTGEKVGRGGQTREMSIAFVRGARGAEESRGGGGGRGEET